MTTVHATLINLKLFFVSAIKLTGDFGLVLMISFWVRLWTELVAEFNVVLAVKLIIVLLLTLTARQLGRWIGEELDDLSDIKFKEYFPCSRNVFELLKDPNSHGLMYKQNYDYEVDGNKINVYSKVLGIKTIEEFELIVNKDSVELKNIGGKFESNVTYSYDGFGIKGHWTAKPRGLRRALSLVISGVVKKGVVRDFNKFVKKNTV